MRVVPRRTVAGDNDRRLDNLSESHHQSHVNCVSFEPQRKIMEPHKREPLFDTCALPKSALKYGFIKPDKRLYGLIHKPKVVITLYIKH